MAYRYPGAFAHLLYSQLFVTMPVPTQSFLGQTVIITGSNTGLGREAANHITRLGAEKVILAVRTVAKGEEAKQYIEERTGRKGVVEVWSLDLSSYASVKAFVHRAEILPRLDVVLANAGVLTNTFTMVEGNESSITVNVISTFLLALMILPKLRETATKFNVTPRLSITCSDVHNYTYLPAKAEPRILDAMSDPQKAKMAHRYTDSKMLQVLYLRELAPRLTASEKSEVTLNFFSPGFCQSDLFGEQEKVFGFNIGRQLVARSTEEGSRALVAAVVEGNRETHGQYMWDAKVAKVSTFARSTAGAETGRRVWKEINEKLEAIEPGLLENI